MTDPQISILLPIRNEQQYLIPALRSLQRQTYRNWELVAVDDGSTDRTPEILQSFAAEDSRFILHKQPAKGLVVALNHGLNHCRGTFVARMDADDICHPQRLEKQLRCFHDDPSLTLVATCVRHFPRMHIQDGMLAYEHWQNALLDHDEIIRNLFVESPFAHPSVMFRRSEILKAGGYRERPWAEDYDLWLRLAEQGSRFAKCPETLLYWRDRPQRLTRTAKNCALEAFRHCKAHFLRRGFLKGSSGVTLWGAGPEGKEWRKALLKEGINVIRWIDVDSGKIGQKIHGAPVFEPNVLKENPGRTLFTVGSKGAREQFRAWATHAGLQENSDYLCVT